MAMSELEEKILKYVNRKDYRPVKPRVIAKVGTADNLEQSTPMAVQRRPNVDVSVVAAIHVERRNGGKLVTGSFRNLTQSGHTRKGVTVRQQRIEQRDIDLLTLTCLVAMTQGSERREQDGEEQPLQAPLGAARSG